MDSTEISYLLQAAFCRVRVLASQPIDDERRQLIWEIVDTAHNLPLVLTGAQTFSESTVLVEIETLERLLAT